MYIATRSVLTNVIELSTVLSSVLIIAAVAHASVTVLIVLVVLPTLVVQVEEQQRRSRNPQCERAPNGSSWSQCHVSHPFPESVERSAGIERGIGHSPTTVSLQYARSTVISRTNDTALSGNGRIKNMLIETNNNISV